MFQIKAQSWKTYKGTPETLALFSFQEETPLLLGLPLDDAARHIRTVAKADGFKSKERELLLVRPPAGKPAERVFLVGLGKKSEFHGEVLRRSAALITRKAQALDIEQIAVRAPEIGTSSEVGDELQALAEGLLLAAYRFDKHQRVSEDQKALRQILLLVEGDVPAAQKTIDRASIFSSATTLVRDLINEPPSLMNPERLAQEALKLKNPSISVRVFEKKDLEKMGMGAILGVGVGGAVPPRLVELRYKPSSKPKRIIALVGKGITFDSGGLSLKPAQSMETMKDDMSGAATVIGVMSALSKLKLPLEVRGYLAIAENMPGGRATKPGDVLKTYKGKTIEVLNTDAEGRLVLSDALSYAVSQKPDMIIDIATLTGACVVALGSLVTGLMGNTPGMIQGLIQAGEKSGEKFWELPLVKEYKTDIKSKVADIKNIGTRRGEAGTIIGGLFLQEFIDDTPWVHMDIAGPSWVDSDQPYCPTGATGHPVRTLLHYLETLAWK